MEEPLISPDFTGIFEVRRRGEEMLPGARPLSARAGTFDYTEPDSHTTSRIPAPQMPLLDVDRLTTAFPIEGRVVSAVSDVSFALDAGETLALVGESGCGKSLTA